jgi:hypothetical protein
MAGVIWRQSCMWELPNYNKENPKGIIIKDGLLGTKVGEVTKDSLLHRSSYLN